MRTLTTYSTRNTPQTEAIPGSTQVPNNAGGFAWALDDFKRLQQFLILGTEGGTFYVNAKELTKQNAQCVQRCLDADWKRTIDTIVDVSVGGRAYKQDPCIFALSMAASHTNPAARRYALAQLPKVARIGTHLFHFATYVGQFRGWGRGLRDAVANWYQSKPVDKLAYQLVKYQSRDGWSNRDLLRKTHPNASTDAVRNSTYNWVTQSVVTEQLPSIIQAFETAKSPGITEQGIVHLIRDDGLPREAIPTQFLNSPAVWEALLEKMPLTAMIRNLGKMSSVGILNPLSAGSAYVISKITDQEYLRRSRIHPLGVLVALKTYQQGRGVKGSLSWSANQKIVDALDSAFYLAFGNVRPTNKRILLALDISGSMGWGDIAGLPGISPRVGSAALAMVTSRVEPSVHTMAFATEFTEITWGDRSRLDDVISKVSSLQMGGTDCALPMKYALEKGLDVDAFIVMTDSETWAGRGHPAQALRAYRTKRVPEARLIVVGMASNGFSIADPNDAGMLDVVGFDTATPNLISDFITDFASVSTTDTEDD